MDRHTRDSGIAPEIKDEFPEEEEDIVLLSSDSEEDPVPGGDIIPGGFMAHNVEVPVLQHIPEDEENIPEAANVPEAEANNQNQQQDEELNDPDPNDNEADNNMAAQGVQGSQISSISVFSGIAGLDGAAFADAIDRHATSLAGQKSKLRPSLKPGVDLL